jgi:hypothetical protein
MAVRLIAKDDQYVLNHCTKYLARENPEPRHVYGPDAGIEVARIAEAWRFPIIDGHRDPDEQAASQAFNEVTFVYLAAPGALPTEVAVIGSFANLYEPLAMRQVGDTPYFTLTAVVPRGEAHSYRFLVGGEALLDPINPQRMTLDNGRVWSRFFTQDCTIPLVLEHWERRLLERLCDHILPFRTPTAENFLARFYDYLDRQARDAQYPNAYRFDASVGVVNYIDKLLAREESHHQADYRVCLDLINQVVRQRNPFLDPARMARDLYVTLYEEMGRNDVPGWDYGRYGTPRYFLQLLRRHTFTGAFAHPKYGGNAGAAAWAWLAERYRDGDGETLFDWGRALEPPYGRNPAYRG